MCARGVVVWAIFATFFFFLIFHFLQILLLFQCECYLFSTGKFWKQPKGKTFPNRNQSRLLNRDRFLHLSPPPATKKTGTTPGNSFRARLTFTQHTHTVSTGGSTHTGSHVHSPPRKTSQQKKNERTNEKTNRQNHRPEIRPIAPVGGPISAALDRNPVPPALGHTSGPVSHTKHPYFTQIPPIGH